LADYFDLYGNFKYRIYTLQALLIFNELIGKDKKGNNGRIVLLFLFLLYVYIYIYIFFFFFFFFFFFINFI